MKTDILIMNLHKIQFRFETTKFDNGRILKQLYKIDNGVESYMKEVKSYKAGIYYLSGEYLKDWARFTDFADALHEEVKEKACLFHIEPFEQTSTKRFITIEFEGKKIQTEIWVQINCQYEEIDEVFVDYVNVLDDDLNELVEVFIEDFHRILNQALNYSLTS